MDFRSIFGSKDRQTGSTGAKAQQLSASVVAVEPVGLEVVSQKYGARTVVDALNKLNSHLTEYFMQAGSQTCGHVGQELYAIFPEVRIGNQAPDHGNLALETATNLQKLNYQLAIGTDLGSAPPLFLKVGIHSSFFILAEYGPSGIERQLLGQGVRTLRSLTPSCEPGGVLVSDETQKFIMEYRAPTIAYRDRRIRLGNRTDLVVSYQYDFLGDVERASIITILTDLDRRTGEYDKINFKPNTVEMAVDKKAVTPIYFGRNGIAYRTPTRTRKGQDVVLAMDSDNGRLRDRIGRLGMFIISAKVKHVVKMGEVYEAAVEYTELSELQREKLVDLLARYNQS